MGIGSVSHSLALEVLGSFMFGGIKGQQHHDVLDDDDDDVYDDDDGGYPANYHRSHSHQVGICHDDEGWEYDTVKFPPYT